MLKSAFNKTAQFCEDAAYGVMLESMSAGRKLRLNLWSGLAAGVGLTGALTDDVGAVVLSAGLLLGSAAAFADAGQRIRQAAPQP